MKHKLLKSCLFLAFTLMTVTTGFSGYQIQEEGPQATPGNVDENKDTDKDYHKVTFQNSATGKTTTRYYEDGYILSMADLADATSDDPNTMYVSGSQYLSWKAEGGTYAGQALSTHIEVTEDLILEGTATTYTNTVSASCLGANNTSFSSRTEETYQTTTLQPTYEETLTYGSQFVGAPDNIIRLTSEGYNQSVELKFMAVTAEVGKKGTFGLRDNDLSFSNGRYYSTTCINQFGDGRSDEKERGGTINIKLSAESVDKNLPNGYPQVSGDDNKYYSYNADETIGLSNTEANTTEGGDQQYKTPYKQQVASNTSATYTYSQTYASYSRNYCANRIVLFNDVVFSSSITIGGMTGFFGKCLDFSQSGYQGYINGTYCEIDLNGYDLILSSGSQLISYGSITDSSRFGFDNNNNPIVLENVDFGSLVLLADTKLQSPLVFEDDFIPMSAPVSYLNNNAPFNFFRCPYLDCKTIFYPNCQFIGEYKIDMAGIKSGSIGAGIQGTLNLIGSNIPNTLLNLVSGKISRNVSYDLNLLSFADNLYNQIISYDAQNAYVKFDPWVFSFATSHPVNINESLDSRKYQFFIPFYFRVSLSNSTLELNQELVFMAGSHMIVDKTSKIIMSYSEILVQSKTQYFDEQKFQTSAGLTFLDTFYYSQNHIGKNKDWPLYDAANTNLFTNSKYTGTASSNNLWYRLSQTPAYCILDGTIELKANQTIKQYHPFVFGGQMKISNMSAFKAQVVAWNAKADSNYQKVQLYGNYCMMGPNSTSSLGSLVLGVGQRYNYVRGFYSPPLMNLNNTVLVDITTQDSTYESSACSSGTNLFTTLSNFQYDSLTGVISDGQKSYAFLPNYSWSQTNNDHEANNFYKAYSLDLEDDLAGHFYQVSVTDHYVTSNGKNNGSPNIFYRGLFVWADSVSGSSAQVKLYKFIGGQNNCYSSTYNLAFNSSTKQWTYSSKA